MEKRIITVSREFGSGGRTIAKKLANSLNVTYYDKELVKKIALQTGFDTEYIEENSEYASGRNILAYLGSASSSGSVMHGLSASDFLWSIQRQVILDIADKEPCVILGRCADYILKDRDDCINVFIHADKALRADRIVRIYGESDKRPEKRLDEKDGKRRANYKYFTDKDWGIISNYHLTLDSGELGIDRCVEVIADLYQSFNNEG